MTITSPGTPVDVSAILLGADGKVRNDNDLVFYNHPAQDGVTVAGPVVTADLSRVPAAIDRIAVVASIDVAHPGARFDDRGTPSTTVAAGTTTLSFTPPAMTAGETVVITVELYRRAGSWKVRAVGQGWSNGLAGLAADFGIVVDDPGPATPVPEPARRYASAPPPQPVRPGPAPAPLGKISLTKGGQATINMRKDDPSLVVTASLEWNGGSRFRRQSGADLDLYALFIPRELVTPKGARTNKSSEAVYYRNLGSPTIPPYIALDGDARTPGRETITIHRPDRQGYVLICAYSAVENGVGSFKSYGARAVVTDGRGSTVTVPLFNERRLSYWVAIALIDFTVPNGAEIRHVEKYSGNHQEARPMLYSNGNFKMSVGPVEFKTR
ncbi:TerD family protein [Spirillospora sp. NPDC050679]